MTGNFDNRINQIFSNLVEYKEKPGHKDPIAAVTKMAADYENKKKESPIQARLQDRVTGGSGRKAQELAKKYTKIVLKKAEDAVAELEKPPK